MKDVIVACIQMNIDDFSLDSQSNYQKYLRKKIEETIQYGATMVVFPGLSYSSLKNWRVNGYANFNDFFTHIVEYSTQIKEEFIDFHSRLSKNYGIISVPGSIIEINKEGMFHSAYLFDENGKTHGPQLQTHLSRFELSRGFARGKELVQFETRIGKIGIVLGTDAWYPEVSRIFMLKNTEILICPNYILNPPSQWLQISGMWQQAQQNQIFALECCLNGRIGSDELLGTSGIYAPCEMTEGEMGFLIRAKDSKSHSIICKIDSKMLTRVRNQYPLADLLNRKIYDKLFHQIYDWFIL